ncbi:N-acetyltransferase [Clostridiaceae bacterium M8S5]|nr:N-acetyltransferase [Clostridiaceae bacterium M8S5]
MIRKIKKTAHEIENIMQLWLRSTIKAHPFIPEDYWNSNYEDIKDKYIPLSDVYVYLENKTILGFISIINKEFIGAIFVDVNTQGKGIGKKLIQHSMDIYGELTLAVYKDNLQAVEFYKHVGFTVINEQLNKETNKLEYIMVKKQLCSSK